MIKHLLVSLLACAALQAHASSATPSPQHDKAGFTTFLEDGRLWVFTTESKELDAFKQHGEPVKQFTEIGVGPDGMTVKAARAEDLSRYLGK